MKRLKYCIPFISLSIIGCHPKSSTDNSNLLNPSMEEQRVSLEESASQGNIDAQINLGSLYESGTFGSENKFKYTKWLRKAAEQGDKKSQWKLGLMYLHRKDMPQNNAKAVKWLTESANQDYRMAQLALAFMYRDGKSTIKDKAKAEWYYKKACSDIDFSNMSLPHPDTVPGQCLIYNNFKDFKPF